MKTILVTLIFLLSARISFAYPQFIAHGYNTCLTCHYNPLGGGPVNDYGRKLGANTIASKALYPSSLSEEQISEYSGFFFQDNKSRVKPHLNYRGLSLTNNFSKESSQERFINMEAKIGATAILGKKKNIILNGTISYLLDTQNDDDKFRSREYYIGYRSEKNWGVYAGFLDKTFGLRIPDHIAYSKASNGLAQNDQTHGVLFNWIKDKWNFNAHIFMGSLTQESDLQQRGGSARFEYNITDNMVLGLSVLNSSSQIVDQQLLALHSKLSIGKGSSLMLEVGRGERTSKVNSVFNNSTYLFSQNHIQIMQGLYYFTTFEYLNATNLSGNKLFRLGAGVQYYPIQKVELRAELVNTRIRSSSVVQEDNWQLQGQVHLWF